MQPLTTQSVMDISALLCVLDPTIYVWKMTGSRVCCYVIPAVLWAVWGYLRSLCFRRGDRKGIFSVLPYDSGNFFSSHFQRQSLLCSSDADCGSTVIQLKSFCWRVLYKDEPRRSLVVSALLWDLPLLRIGTDMWSLDTDMVLSDNPRFLYFLILFYDYDKVRTNKVSQIKLL